MRGFRVWEYCFHSICSPVADHTIRRRSFRFFIIEIQIDAYADASALVQFCIDALRKTKFLFGQRGDEPDDNFFDDSVDHEDCPPRLSSTTPPLCAMTLRPPYKT